MKYEIRDIIEIIGKKEELDKIRHEELLKLINEIKEPVKVKQVSQRMESNGIKTVRELEEENLSLKKKINNQNSSKKTKEKLFKENQDHDSEFDNDFEEDEDDGVDEIIET